MPCTFSTQKVVVCSEQRHSGENKSARRQSFQQHTVFETIKRIVLSAAGWNLSHLNTEIAILIAGSSLSGRIIHLKGWSVVSWFFPWPLLGTLIQTRLFIGYFLREGYCVESSGKKKCVVCWHHGTTGTGRAVTLGSSGGCPAFWMAGKGSLMLKWVLFSVHLGYFIIKN